MKTASRLAGLGADDGRGGCQRDDFGKFIGRQPVWDDARRGAGFPCGEDPLMMADAVRQGYGDTTVLSDAAADKLTRAGIGPPVKFLPGDLIFTISDRDVIRPSRRQPFQNRAESFVRHSILPSIVPAPLPPDIEQQTLFTDTSRSYYILSTNARR